jgi:Tfp pilus assembly protein PilE
MRTARGFTLFELIIVVVFISAAFVSIGGLFHMTQAAYSDVGDMQRVSQYLQECAELVLGTRRDLGIDSSSLNDSMCSSPSGFTRTVSGTTSYNTAAPCPSSTNCKQVVVTVTKGAMSASTTILLVDY